MIRFFPDVIDIGTIQRIFDFGIAGREPGQGFGQHPGYAGFHTAYSDGTAQQITMVGDVPHRLFPQRNNFLRPLLKQDARLCQRHLTLTPDQ